MSGISIIPLQHVGKPTARRHAEDRRRKHERGASKGRSLVPVDELADDGPQPTDPSDLEPGMTTFRRSRSESSLLQSYEARSQRNSLSTYVTVPNIRAGPGAIGAAISKPEAASQWSSRGPGRGSVRRLNNSPTRETSRSGRVVSPLQPPRPSYVPSLDSPKFQSQLSGLPNRLLSSPRPAGENWEDSSQRTPGLPSPAGPPSSFRISSLYGPVSTSSRPSTTSSVGSVPEFPFPGAPAPRRGGNNAPSALRRGASSYYSQYSYVTPIPEESSEQQLSHGSFASSRVIPLSWGSLPSEYISSPSPYNTRNGEQRDIDGDGGSPTVRQDAGGEAPASQGNMIPHYQPLRVNQPLGLATDKPSFGVYGSSSDLRDPLTQLDYGFAPSGTTEVVAPRPRSAVMASPALGLETLSLEDPSKPINPDEHFARAPLALKTTSSSPSLSPHSRSPAVSPNDAMAQQILRDLHKGTSLDKSSSSFGPSPPTENLARGQFPAPQGRLRLNIGAVREEARGSLTSLPDLIKRATRLATVLDRGQAAGRPVHMSSLDGEGGRRTDGAAVPSGKPGSLSDILAYFPSPGTRDGAASQSSYRFQRPTTSSPGTFSSTKGRSLAKPPPRRRCCGMRMKVFLILVVLAILLIVAAVILPIVFIVLPRRHHSGAATDGAGCPADFQCLNGGSSVFDANACHCVCINGFTGDRCAVAATNSCVTEDFNSDGAELRGVTVGSSIPRLIRQGPEKFHIPLSVSTLLTLFSTTGLTCNSENALVTFGTVPSPSQSQSSPTAANTNVQKRDSPILADNSGPTPTAVALSVATTVNGLVFATSSTPSPSGGSSSGGGQPASSPFFVDEDALDFAGVSVLFVLQQTSLDKAITAQQRLASFLGNFQTTSTVNLANGLGVDLRKHTFLFVNGTIIGGGSNSTVTKV